MRKVLNINTQSHTLTKLNIEVHFQELVQTIQISTKKSDILAIAKKTLDKVNNTWNPAIVYRWLPFESSKTEPEKSVIRGDNGPVLLDLGYSSKFVNEARFVLVAVYSLGNALEKEVHKSSANGDFLVSFFLDLIGMFILEKTGDIIKKIAEKKAADLGWGVSPFLSPGSIHGWSLEEQLKLCPLLPLKNIEVKITKNAVLVPFKSLSCLIGIGSGYSATLVGTTCQVCSQNDVCQMKQL